MQPPPTASSSASHAASSPDSNPTLRLIAKHKSVRDFTDAPIPVEHPQQAVRCAQQTATSSWIQAYSLIQVDDPDERKRLAQLCGPQEQVERCAAFFVLCADTRRHHLLAQRAEVAFESNLEVFMLALIDASLFAQSLVLAYESMGYGSCYIGGLRNDLPAVDELLELPEGVMPLFGLCVGRAAKEDSLRPRLPLDAVLMRGRYASDEQMLAAIARHDEEAADYYERRGAAGRNWSGGIWRKFRKKMRQGLSGYYASKGAHLD